MDFCCIHICRLAYRQVNSEKQNNPHHASMSRPIMIVLWLVCLSFASVYAQGSELCDMRGNTAVKSDVPEFLFSHAYKTCPDLSFPFQYQLSASACAEGYYTRVGLQFPTASPTSSYSTFKTTIQHIGTDTGSGCLSSSDVCGTAACEAVSPIVVTGLSSRVYVKYNLFSIGQVPFSFLPVDDDGVACGSPASCECEFSGSGVLEQGPCTITDTIAAPLNTNCGANRDPDTGFSDSLNQACNSVCCASCPAESTANPSTHKRWAVGPTCTVYQLSGSQWVGHAGFFVDVTNTNGPQQLFVKIQDMTEGSVELDEAMGINHIRAYINKHYTGKLSSLGVSPSVTSGLVVVCDYNPDGNSAALGKVNPYVNLKSPFTVETHTVSDPIFRVPGTTASPSNLGAGKVPTQTIFAKNVSMFYIPAEYQSAFASNFGGGYLEHQNDVLSEWKLGSPANFKNASWWDAYTNVPGWQLNPTDMTPKVPSPCQMSHEINTYANTYATAFSMNGGNATAAKETAGTPPKWLMPNYDITKPNWWPNVGDEDSEVWFDIGTVLPGSESAYEVYLDFTQDNVETNGGPVAIVEIDDRSGCAYNSTGNTGAVIVYLENTEISSVGMQNFIVNLTTTCQFTYNDSTTANAIFSMNSGIETNVLLPPMIQTATPLFLFSSPATPLLTKHVAYVNCSVKVFVPTVDDPIVSPVLNCLIPLVDSQVSQQLNQLVQNVQTADKCGTCNFSCLNDEGRLTTSSCFIMVMVLSGIAVVAVIGLIVGCVCISSEKKKKEKALQ